MTLLKLLAAALTVAYGIWAVFMPEEVMSLVGMAAEGPRGITEARAALGALYIGLGIYCLWVRTPAAFATLGAGYAAMAAVRLIAIFTDNSADTSNWASLAIEVLCAIVLLL